MSTDPTPPEPAEHDPDIMADEAPLGLLDDGYAAEAAATPAFNRALQSWQHRLSPLLDEVAPVAPPPRLWPAIEAAIGAPGRRRPGLWHSLTFWRGFGLGAGGLGVAGLAAALAAVLLLNHPASPAPIATAMLGTAGNGGFVAVEQPAGDGGLLLVVSPAQATVPAGKSAELWLLLPGAKAQPLGLLAGAHPVAFRLAGSQAAGLGAAQLAISLEPQGGSPDGTVTGPVIAAAKLSPL